MTTDISFATEASPRSGVILFAHGSRDPLWRTPMEAVAQSIAVQQPEMAVACAYLELCTPTLEQVVDDWAARHIGHVSVVPMFLGAGRHVREDLPRMLQALRERHPELTLSLQPPIGEDARLTQLMARIAMESAL